MGRKGGSSSEGAPMKVVYINTQYVETDARSFKSVVQELTGKDSKVADMDSPRKNIVRGPSNGRYANEKTEFTGWNSSSWPDYVFQRE